MPSYWVKRLLVFGIVATTAVHAANGADFPFEIQTAERQAVVVKRVFDGMVESKHQSTVSAQTPGRIAELNFDVDDLVPEGSVILRLHDIEQRANLHQEQAALKDAQARNEEAREEFKRIKNLVEKRLASQADLDRVVAQLDSSKAKIELAKARVVQAREQLDYTVVKAPYSGVVVKRHVELGESVQPGQALMTGFSLDHLRVVTAVPQGFITAVRKASAATVILDDAQPAIVSQQLTVFPYADPQSHTFKIRVSLPEGTAGLYPGTLVKVAFDVGSAKRLLVPLDAIVHRSEVTGVYVADESKSRVDFRYVVTGKPHGDQVEVLAGLDQGERVALDPIAAGIYVKESQR